jgi:hypothetical protein
MRSVEAESESLTLLAQKELRDDKPTKIDSLCIPTCNRIDGLDRCIVSYIENCKEYEKSNDFVIVDDSSDKNIRSAYRERLQMLKKRYGVNILYAGFEEKLLFARKLISVSKAPPEVIKFALFNTEKSLPSIGANRNAMLLHTVGNRFLSVDDDTLCRATIPSGIKPGSIFKREHPYSSSQPCEVTIYPNMHSLKDSLSFLDIDVLSMHENFLGRGFIRDDTEEISHVLITLNGIAGDCGWGSPSNYLWLTESSFERLTSSESVYRSACISRELLRVTNQVTITDGSRNMMATFSGFDNREFLPPFMPYGRGEDAIFGMTLSKAFKESLFAYLPFALLHIPVESRKFWPGEINRAASGIDLHFLLVTLINAFNFSTGLKGSENISNFGSYLEGLGKMPYQDFEEVLYANLLCEIEDFLSYLEDRLSLNYALSEFWSKDVEKFICSLRLSVNNRSVTVPLDLLYGRTVIETQNLTQRLILRFGQLLSWWTEIVDAAKTLRLKEQLLAQPL